MLTSYKEVSGQEYTEFKYDYVQKTHHELILRGGHGVYENYDGELLVAKIANGKYYILDNKITEDDKILYYREMNNGISR